MANDLCLFSYLLILNFCCGSTFDNLNWRSESDLIRELPGLRQMPSYNMFSGYLAASSTKRLHYWFNECQDPNSQTLILWFNGGPGCSSLDGLFIENGPMMFDKLTGNIIENPYSWNKLGHTLYIESPVGVGFSYDTSNSGFNDIVVAKDNLRALKDFFLKFPSYEDCLIYISGESYAGVYVPLLIQAILDDGDLQTNLKGMMIGNGLFNTAINDESLMYYTFYHGLYGPSLWDKLHEYCCNPNGQCRFNAIYNEDCLLKLSRVHHIVTNEGINLYNLYADCYTGSQSVMINQHRRQLLLDTFDGIPTKTMQKDQMTGNLGLIPACSNASLITNYLNREDVQSALHVRRGVWEICNETVLKEYEKSHPDMSAVLQNILATKDDFRMILYFGDTDMACNHLGGEWFVDQLGYEIVLPRRKWTVSRTDESNQVAGFYKEFDRIIYSTVKGAGHMVPADKPYEAYTMIQRFLEDVPL